MSHSVKQFFTLFFCSVLLCGLVFARVDLDRMQSLALSRYGPNTAKTVAQWRTFIRDITPLPETEKIKRVNEFFNLRIRYVEDIVSWGQEDYWATPLETLARRQGDCEDYSIAKFVTLLLAGVNMDKLRITYVKAQVSGPQGRRSVAHMVLAYYPTPKANPLVLDNIIPRVLPASRRTDLKPVFGFNSKGIWVGAAPAPASRNPGSKLSRWGDLLLRMRNDGIG